MAINIIAEQNPGTEQYVVKKFADLLRPSIEKLGYRITTQFNLPYANFCDRLDCENRAIDYNKGKKSYAVDILIYRELSNNEKVPLVVVEGKIKSYSSHDVITYSEKARHHKMVFPHLQYGFVVLESQSENFSLRYHLHSGFDFEEIFPVAETEAERNGRIITFIHRLKEQVELADRKHRIFFAA